MNIRNLIKHIKCVLLITVLFNSNSIYAEIGGDFTLKDQNNNKYILSDSSKVKIIFMRLIF